MPPPSTPGKRVLVVEDDASIRDVLSFHLGLAKYDTTVAAEGKLALVLLQSRPFGIVVLDLVVPGVDGMTLCQTMRESGPNREVPLLMLTARREESDKVLGLKSGADDYLTKPFGAGARLTLTSQPDHGTTINIVTPLTAK